MNFSGFGWTNNKKNSMPDSLIYRDKSISERDFENKVCKLITP